MIMGYTKPAPQNRLYRKRKRGRNASGTRKADRRGNLTYSDSTSTETKGNWNWERGGIDRAMIERHLSKEEISNAIFYICGPPGMINAVKGDLLQRQLLLIPEERIKVEEFTGY